MNTLDTILQLCMNGIEQSHGTDGIWNYRKFSSGLYIASAQISGGASPISTMGTLHLWRMSATLPTVKTVSIIVPEFTVGSLVTLQAQAYVSGGTVYVYGTADSTGGEHLECSVLIIGVWK